MKITAFQKLIILILSLVLIVMGIDFILNLTVTEFLSMMPFTTIIGAIILYIIIDNDENDCDPFK